MTGKQRRTENIRLVAIELLEEAIECIDGADKEALIDELNKAYAQIQQTIEHINNIQ